MSASTLTAACDRLQLSSFAHLPSEILFGILLQLDDARDLYRSSLVNKEWRSIATDDRLWEWHYWQIYRPIRSSDSKDQDALTMCYERRKTVGMREWLNQAASDLPSSELFETYTESVRQAIRKLHAAKQEAKEQGSVAATEALQVAEESFNAALRPPKPIEAHAARVPTPSFLQTLPRADKLPAFYCLFRSRLAADDKLLRKLRQHLELTHNLMPDLRKIAVEQSGASRSLFAALVATQPVTADSIEDLVPKQASAAGSSPDDDSTIWPCAFEIHTAAARGESLPVQAHCLDLRLAALRGLSHLEHLDAVDRLHRLKEQRVTYDADTSSGSLDNTSGAYRRRLHKHCEALESAMEAVALFRSANASEIRQYLDYLALFVWTDLGAQERFSPQTLSPHPPGSTRRLMANIVASLHVLGFAVAAGTDADDTDNAFVHTALYCPAQRRTSALTLASIISAVARRLGVAASVSRVASPVLIAVVEDGRKPDSWKGESALWSQFLIHVDDRQQRWVWEVEEMADHLGQAQAKQGMAQHPLLQPASPLAVLERIARDILQKTSQDDRESPTRWGKPARYPAEDDLLACAACWSELGKLRFFLEGRVDSTFGPLLPPLMPSSLALIPPTDAHAVYEKWPHVAEDVEYCAEYCAKWVLKVVAPQHLGGVNAAKEELGKMIGETASEVFLLDCYLLTPGKGRLAGYGTWPESVRRLLHQNELAGSGLGGIGSYPMYILDRPWGAIVARRYLDPAESANSEVKFGVGMVVKHDIFSWHGVVVGWDTGCRAEERWMKFADVVSGRVPHPPSRRRCCSP